MNYELRIMEQEVGQAQGVELEDSSIEEEYQLRAETERMLDYAVGHGLCTAEDAAEWMVGFDACEKIEYKQNLVMILAEKCLPSGEEMADECEEVIHSPYLSVSRRREVEQMIKTASVAERKEIIKSVKKEIEEKKRRYGMFNRLLLKIQVGSLRKQFEQKFADADLIEANRLINELNERTEKKERLEVVTPDIHRALDKVRQYISQNKFSAARELLNSIGVALNFSGEYTQLSRLIDTKEIERTRQKLKDIPLAA